ncbi:MAG: hypothetical protein HY817_00470 [Candidatus Abawacabacteria bacterium]|nr:hypothetical protein [Candidatus Abawacabacteria bacterium]
MSSIDREKISIVRQNLPRTVRAALAGAVFYASPVAAQTPPSAAEQPIVVEDDINRPCTSADVVNGSLNVARISSLTPRQVRCVSQSQWDNASTEARAALSQPNLLCVTPGVIGSVSDSQMRERWGAGIRGMTYEQIRQMDEHQIRCLVPAHLTAILRSEFGPRLSNGWLAEISDAQLARLPNSADQQRIRSARQIWREASNSFTVAIEQHSRREFFAAAEGFLHSYEVTQVPQMPYNLAIAVLTMFDLSERVEASRDITQPQRAFVNNVLASITGRLAVGEPVMISTAPAIPYSVQVSTPTPHTEQRQAPIGLASACSTRSNPNSGFCEINQARFDRLVYLVSQAALTLSRVMGSDLAAVVPPLAANPTSAQRAEYEGAINKNHNRVALLNALRDRLLDVRRNQTAWSSPETNINQGVGSPNPLAINSTPHPRGANPRVVTVTEAHPLRLPAMIVAGVGVGAALAGGIGWAVTSGEANDRVTECERNGCSESAITHLESLNGRANLLTGLGWAGVGIAAIGGVGTVLFWNRTTTTRVENTPIDTPRGTPVLPAARRRTSVAPVSFNVTPVLGNVRGAQVTITF